MTPPPSDTDSEPSIARILLALAVTPFACTLPLFIFPVLGAVLGLFIFSELAPIVWVGFAPAYFIARRRARMSFAMILTLMLVATLVGAAQFALESRAIDIHLAPPPARLGIFLDEWLSGAKRLIVFGLFGASIFWLMTRRRSKICSNPAIAVLVFADGLAKLAKSRALYALVALAGASAIWAYSGVVAKYTSQEAADDGVRRLHDDSRQPDPAYVTIKIPKNFQYQTRGGDVAGFGLSFRTFYPDFGSPRDPDKIAEGKEHSCAGVACPGEINFSIAFSSANDPGAKALKSFLVHEGRYGRRVNGDFGFDEAVKVVETGDVFFVKRGPAPDRVDFGAECQPELRVACRLYLALSCNRGVNVQFYWPYARMREAAELRQKLEAFISPMIVSPDCGA